VLERQALKNVGVSTLIFSLFLLTVGMGSVAATSSTHTTITECQTIDEPGEYTLDSDLTTDNETCLEITASDVTIEGNEQTIERTDTDSADGNVVGVFVDRNVDNPTNITVKNLTTTGWEYGVRFDGVKDSQIQNVTAEDNVQHGIDVRFFSENVTVADSVAVDNGDRGIYFLSFTDESSVVNSVAKGNGFENPNGAGIGVAVSSDENTLKNNTLVDNRNGVFVGSFSSDNVIRNSEISKNDVGVFLDDSDNEITKNDITDNDKGLINEGSGTATAIENWWGHASGPGGDDGRTNPAGKVVGQGDEIEGDTEFDPWLRQPIDKPP